MVATMGKRVNLYLTDDLYRRARAQLGDEHNWSATFRSHLESLIGRREGCTHPVVMCRDCGEVVDVDEGVSP